MMAGMPERRTDYAPARHHQPVGRIQHRRRDRRLRSAPQTPRGGVQKVPDLDRQGRPRRSGDAPVCGNLATHKTPAIHDRLTKRPRFHVHFTPTGSSWTNQIERWFGYLTDQLARRGVHKSVQALENDVRAWIQQWNTNPQALGVEEGRRRDPRLTRQISTRNFRCRTLGVPGRDVGDGRLIGEVTV